jgi:hypothetical protein
VSGIRAFALAVGLGVCALAADEYTRWGRIIREKGIKVE